MDNNWKVNVVIFDALLTSPPNLKALFLAFKTYLIGNEKLVIIMQFGSESVYCGNTWQSVLQTCSELNQIQTSKMLSILGKLDEDVSFLLLIKLHFVHYFFVHVCVANN